MQSPVVAGSIIINEPDAGVTAEIEIKADATYVLGFDISNATVELVGKDAIVMAFENGGTLNLNNCLFVVERGDFTIETHEGLLISGKDFVDAVTLDLGSIQTDGGAGDAHNQEKADGQDANAAADAAAVAATGESAAQDSKQPHEAATLENPLTQSEPQPEQKLPPSPYEGLPALEYDGLSSLLESAETEIVPLCRSVCTLVPAHPLADLPMAAVPPQEDLSAPAPTDGNVVPLPAQLPPSLPQQPAPLPQEADSLLQAPNTQEPEKLKLEDLLDTEMPGPSSQSSELSAATLFADLHRLNAEQSTQPDANIHSSLPDASGIEEVDNLLLTLFRIY